MSTDSPRHGPLGLAVGSLACMSISIAAAHIFCNRTLLFFQTASILMGGKVYGEILRAAVVSIVGARVVFGVLRLLSPHRRDWVLKNIVPSLSLIIPTLCWLSIYNFNWFGSFPLVRWQGWYLVETGISAIAVVLLSSSSKRLGKPWMIFYIACLLVAIAHSYYWVVQYRRDFGDPLSLAVLVTSFLTTASWFTWMFAEHEWAAGSRLAETST
jgi:hypothetical protein